MQKYIDCSDTININKMYYYNLNLLIKNLKSRITIVKKTNKIEATTIIPRFFKIVLELKPRVDCLDQLSLLESSTSILPANENINLIRVSVGIILKCTTLTIKVKKYNVLAGQIIDIIGMSTIIYKALTILQSNCKDDALQLI